MQCLQNDDIARSYFMYNLVHFKDHDSLHIIELFKNDMIDEGLMSMEYVFEDYSERGNESNSLNTIFAKDSLDIFKDIPNIFYRNYNQGKCIPPKKSNLHPTLKNIPMKEEGEMILVHVVVAKNTKNVGLKLFRYVYQSYHNICIYLYIRFFLIEINQWILKILYISKFN